MAARQGMIEIKEYSLTVARNSRWLVLKDPGNNTGPFFQLQLVFLDPLPPFQGTLLPSRQAHCYLPLGAFGDCYHVVQTEKPVYAHAWWNDTDNSVFDAFV